MQIEPNLWENEIKKKKKKKKKNYFKMSFAEMLQSLTNCIVRAM